jgi:chromosome segregation ATPase
MEILAQLLNQYGPFTLALVVVFAFFWDKNRAETKTENTVSDIAGNMPEVLKQLGDIRQNLGRAEGQNIVLMDNLKTLEQKREAESVLTKDKIYVLQEKIEKQTILISRHEGRIIQLELESKQKDDIITVKEHEIVELKIDNARQKVVIETQETTISGLNRRLELMTRVQSLDETIPIPELELAAADATPNDPIAAPTPETNEEERKIA